MNDVDFNIKMNQTLNAYPDAEIELKRMAESTDFQRMLHGFKVQMKEGGLYVAGGATARVSTKLILGGLAGPLAATIFAGLGIGWWRGGIKGKQDLQKEEELIRMGFEEQTSGNKKVGKLLKDKAITAMLLSKADTNGTSPESKEYMERKIKWINDEIVSIRAKGTESNLQDSTSLSSKLGSKIDQLKGFLQMEYKDYVNTPEGKKASPEDFEKKRIDWAEKLEVRLEYTKNKLDAGKIVFGKEEVALGNRYELIKKMAEASAEVSLIPSHEEIVFKRIYGDKTRRSQIEKVLLTAEEKIAKNQSSYVLKKKIIGALSGGALSGAGFSVSHLAMEHFGSTVSHFINEKASGVAGLLGYAKGKEINTAMVDAVKTHIAHEHTEAIIHDHIKLDLNTKATDFTNDLPKTSDVTHLYNHNILSTKVVENHVETIKPFEYVLKNQTQSREYALIKYYESKGLSHHDAGTKANLVMREMYGPKGERAANFVHKGDHIVITEENGKPHIEVVSGKHVNAVHTPEKATVPSHEQVKGAVENKPVRILKPTTPAPEHAQEVVHVNNVEHPLANHPIAEHLAKDPQKYGFKGNIKNPEEVKAWLDKNTSQLIDKNPQLKNIPPEHIKEVYRTVTGGVHVETVNFRPENMPTSLALYEVKTPTSLPVVLENILAKDPRWANLSGDEKDRVLYQLFVKQFVGPGHDAVFYKNLGIRSGNPLDIKPGALKLNGAGGKYSLDNAFNSAHDSSLNISKGFRNKIGTIIKNFKDLDPEDMEEGLIKADLNY